MQNPVVKRGQCWRRVKQRASSARSRGCPETRELSRKESNRLMGQEWNKTSQLLTRDGQRRMTPFHTCRFSTWSVHVLFYACSTYAQTRDTSSVSHSHKQKGGGGSCPLPFSSITLRGQLVTSLAPKPLMVYKRAQVRHLCESPNTATTCWGVTLYQDTATELKFLPRSLKG